MWEASKAEASGGLPMLARYKVWANDLLYAAVARLPAHELIAPRPIVFGSMLRTLNHVYAMDRVWQAHLEGRPHGLTTRNPDDAPPLTEEWFESADLYHGDKLIRRGRPKKVAPKEPVNIRLDPNVLAHFRATGRGWQSRINAILRKAAGL